MKVIEYLVEIHQKDNTVEDVMERFGLTCDQYRMCCNLAMPALRPGNIKGRFTAVSRTNKAMRKEVKALYELAKDGDGPLEKGVKLMYETYCLHTQNVVYGKAENAEDVRGAETSSVFPETTRAFSGKSTFPIGGRQP